MKKIILAMDGTNFSTGAFAFIRRLNEMAPVLATGVFVPQQDYANLWSYATPTGAGTVYVPLLEDEENEEVAKNIARFETFCQENGIAYSVHKDFFDFVLPELKRESRFADVMILSGEIFYQRMIGADRFEYLRHILHHSECPVLIVPESFQFPDNNILAYDGSEESVYALKQFAYIFPELAINKTLLVYAEDDEEKDIPGKDLVLELTAQHYQDLDLYKLAIDPQKYFTTWMADRNGAMLISGSFGRSALSETFRKSFVFDIISDHQVPVFIAHK